MTSNQPHNNLQLQVTVPLQSDTTTPIPVLCRQLTGLIDRAVGISNQIIGGVNEWESRVFPCIAQHESDGGDEFPTDCQVAEQNKEISQAVETQQHEECKAACRHISHRAEQQLGTSAEMRSVVQRILSTLANSRNIDDINNQLEEWKRKAQKNIQDNKDAHALLDRQQQQHNKEIALLQERHLRSIEKHNQSIALTKSQNRRLESSLQNCQTVLKETRLRLEQSKKSEMLSGEDLTKVASELKAKQTECTKLQKQVSHLEQSLLSSKRIAADASEQKKLSEERYLNQLERLSSEQDRLVQELELKTHELVLMQSKAEAQVIEIHQLDANLKEERLAHQEAVEQLERLEGKLVATRKRYQKNLLAERIAKESAVQEALQKKLEANEETISNLTQQVSDSKSEIETQRNLAVKYGGQLSTCENALKEQTSTCDLLRIELNELKDRKVYWENEARQQQTIVTELEHTLHQDTIPKLRSVEKELNITKHELHVAESRTQEWKGQLRESEESVATLRSDVQEARQRCSQIVQERNKLQDRVAKLEQEKENFENRFNEQHVQHSILSKSNSTMMQQSQQDQTTVGRLRVELEARQAMLSDANEAKEQVMRQLCKTEKELHDVTTQLQHANKLTVLLKEDLEKSHNRLDQSERRTASESSIIAQLRLRIKELEAKCTTQENQLVEQQHSGAHRDQVNRSLREELRSLSGKLKLLQAVQHQHATTNGMCRAEAESNILETRRQISERLALEQQLIESQQQLEERDSEVHRLRSTLVDVGQEKSMLESQNQHLQHELERNRSLKASSVRTVMEYAGRRKESDEITEMRNVLGEMVQLVETLKLENKGLLTRVKEQAVTIHQLS